MKFKTDNKYLYVEGIQFINGLYETDDTDKIAILKKYADSVKVIPDEKKEDKKSK